MDWYSFRKFLYGTFGEILGTSLIWLGTYLTTTPIETWWIRAIATGLGTVVIAVLRKRFFPGLFGATP